MNCKFAIPMTISSQTFKQERLIEDLRLAKASRVWLATPIYYDKESRERQFDKLGKHIKFVKENGLEAGVWFWALQVFGKHDLTHIHSFNGTSAAECCPLDEDFKAFMRQAIMEIAALGPDLMLFDDDLCFHHLGTGCICKNHLERASEAFGETIVEDGLFQRAFGGKPNKLREALIKSWGDSLREHAVAMRKSLDSVNPAIRLGFCACLNSYDADGTTAAEMAVEGIQKYMFDYTASADYERGYLERHVRNLPVYEMIDKWFNGGEAKGIRVYFSQSKLKDTDFTGLPVEPRLINSKASYSQAADALSCNSIPTIYSGQGNAGIAFWENARHLPDEAFSRPLILDIAAAKILSKKGMDVGIADFGEFFAPKTLVFPDGERVALFNTQDSSFKIALSDKTKVLNTFESGDPACFAYKNEAGHSFLVFNFHSGVCVRDFWRNYRFPKMIAEFCANNDAPLPVYTIGCPDLYLLCKDDGQFRSIGMWNCFADDVNDVVLQLDRSIAEIECFGCDAQIVGDGKILVRHIAAYSFGFVRGRL